jgi:hypothetical protein
LFALLTTIGYSLASAIPASCFISIVVLPWTNLVPLLPLTTCMVHQPHISCCRAFVDCNVFLDFHCPYSLMHCLPLPHAVDFNLSCWDTLLVDMLSDPFSNSCCALMALLQIMFSLITLHICCPLLIQLLAISHALNPNSLSVQM